MITTSTDLCIECGNCQPRPGEVTCAACLDVEKRDRLWKEAQGPRDKRSPEYMRAIKERLDWYADGKPEEGVSNPYPLGTAQADAWWAGNQEGHRRWSES